MHGRDVAVLVCGENNYFWAPRQGAIQIRWPNHLPPWEDHDICFNPQHTIVTRHEVTARLAHLGSGGRLALSAANYDASQGHYARVLQVARNGVVAHNATMAVSRGNGYRLVVVAC